MAGSLKDIDHGWRKLRIELLKLTEHSVVAVGVQGEIATKARDSGITNAQLASVHEFGANISHPGTENGFGQGISIPPHKIPVPERSFLRSTIDEGKSKYAELVEKISGAIVDGRLTVEKGLGVLGEKITGDVKARIASGIEPANKQSTIDRKGSSKPLIDSGQLRNSITYTVRKAGEE